MAELTIRLRIDPATGRKHVVVQLASDEDALPLEHEQQHKELVDRLIAGGALTAAERGSVVVERLPEAAPAAAAPDEPASAIPVARKA